MAKNNFRLNYFYLNDSKETINTYLAMINTTSFQQISLTEEVPIVHL